MVEEHSKHREYLYKVSGVGRQSSWKARNDGASGAEEERCGVWLTRTIKTLGKTLDFHSVVDGKTLEE